MKTGLGRIRKAKGAVQVLPLSHQLSSLKNDNVILRNRIKRIRAVAEMAEQDGLYRMSIGYILGIARSS